MPSLHGARVALLEARLGPEIAELVRRLGGVPVLAASVREIPRVEDTDGFVDALVTGRFPVVVVLTGAAALAVLRAAERRGHLPAALEALKRATLVARGPKPTAVLRRYGLEVHVLPAKPYTTRELIEAIDRQIEVAGREVALIHYGERNAVMADALVTRGARLTDVCPYEWTLPEDVEPLRALVRTLAASADAIAFTSKIQVRHLFAVAAELGLADSVRAALTGDLIVASVGPVSSDTLRQFGVTPDVEPADPKMGPLLTALADYIELTRAAEDGG